MIHVKVRPEDIPADWLDRALKLTEDLKACVDDGDGVPEEDRKTAAVKRKEIVKANEKTWKDLKDILMSWSYKKCWYSELIDNGSDYHVDHFRPKGRVRNPGEPDREGYWWLAFEWTNYRMAVSWCNSAHKAEDGVAKGKQDQFPLSNGCKVATCPEDCLDDEEPVLLDPINPDDVALLDFDETGLPQPTADGWSAERVRQTTTILHLDAPRMKEARQQVWRACSRLLTQAHSLVNQQAADRGVLDRSQLKSRFEDIRMMLRPEAELSAVARSCIERSEYPWARKLLSV